MTRMMIRLLGQLRVLVNGEAVTSFESDKVRALLIYLAVESDRPHRREALAGLLWPERPEQSALNNLRGALSNLRKAINDHAAAPPAILVTRQTIQFNQESDHWLDVSRLAALSGSRGRIPSVEAMEDALSLYQGPLLEGFSIKDSAAFEEWLILRREQLERLATWIYQMLVEQYEQASDYDKALDAAWRWVELDPIDEEAHRQVMRLLAGSGQRTAALSQYEALCRILVEELDVAPSKETEALYQALLTEELSRQLPAHAPPRETSPPPIDLPSQATPFIGRARELNQIAGLLKEPNCQLVTLTGPGGVGKTRLAIEAASRQTNMFTDGIYFVPLAPLTSAEFLASAIATALKFSFYGSDDPKVQLFNHLRDKQMLLVLDNFEHLLEGAGFVAEMLGYAPCLKGLVTSRERLNLQGEWIVEVGGMDYPDEREVTTLETYDAIQLFLQSTRRVQPGFSIEGDDLVFVPRICQLMLGMPLGIELAAAWMRTLSTEQVVSEIEKGLGFLSTSFHDVPERHRSLWAAFDHSWKLLTEEEQAAFSKLSVFRGGFAREAAEPIAGASLPVLAALVDKSLVSRSSGRYEIHELLRQYAESKLANSGDKETIHRAHRDWFLERAIQITPELWGSSEAAKWLGWLSAERDNWRAALQWSISQREADKALQMARALTWYWYVRADFTEGRRWLHRTLEMADHASPENVAIATGYAGVLAIMQRDNQSGVPLSEKALQMCREMGNIWEAGWSLNNLALAAMYQGDFDRAAKYCDESGDTFRQTGHRGAIASLLMYRGVIACYQQEHELAAALFEESLPDLYEVGDYIAIARAFQGLGLTAFHQNDLELAVSQFKKGLELSTDIGARCEMAQLLEGLAAAICKQGKYRRSCVLLGASEQLRHKISTPLSVADKSVYEDCLATLQSGLDADMYSSAWAEGQSMTMKQVLQYALENT